MKDYDKNKESLYSKYWDINNLYGWVMSQTLPVNSFKCVQNRSRFNEGFVKSYNEDSDEGYFLGVDVQCPEELLDLHNALRFLLEITKIEKVETIAAKL